MPKLFDFLGIPGALVYSRLFFTYVQNFFVILRLKIAPNWLKCAPLYVT